MERPCSSGPGCTRVSRPTGLSEPRLGPQEGALFHYQVQGAPAAVPGSAELPEETVDG